MEMPVLLVPGSRFTGLRPGRPVPDSGSPGSESDPAPWIHVSVRDLSPDTDPLRLISEFYAGTQLYPKD